jgi:hypothetical protein
MANDPDPFQPDGTCAFTLDPTSIGTLVINFVFLVVFLLIFFLWVKDIKSSDTSRKTPVFGFTVALVAALMCRFPLLATRHCRHSALIIAHRSYTLEIAGSFVLYCAYKANAALGLDVGADIASGIQYFISLGIVLLYVVPMVVDISPPFRFAQAIALAIITTIFIPSIVVSALYTLGIFVLDRRAVPSPTVALNLNAAYNFLAFCVATHCVGMLIYSRFTRSTTENGRKVS